MKNIFADLDCSLVYDLKGSTHGRKANRVGGKLVGALKDLDWIEARHKFKLDKGLQSFISQVLESDVSYLQSINIMDYSLILGIQPIPPSNPDHYIQQLTRPEDSQDAYKNGVKKAIHNRFRGGTIANDKSCIYGFGIIDIYTLYSGKKKSEHFFKTIFHGSGISSVNPEVYGARFRSFISSTFG